MLEEISGNAEHISDPMLDHNLEQVDITPLFSLGRHDRARSLDGSIEGPTDRWRERETEIEREMDNG